VQAADVHVVEPALAAQEHLEQRPAVVSHGSPPQ
jgi:hypothetical protein